MANVEFRGVVKQYGDHSAVVKNLNLDVRSGEFMVLVGPSGCGKSTTLRMLAGLEDVTDGQIWIDGQNMTDVPPAQRGLAMVFQSYALYPHMTVAQNMGFALKMAGRSQADVAASVQRAAQSLQLEALLERKPRELSGGQRQRVAIGRAIVREPRVFLFDEPLSNLDASLRNEMRVELSRLHERLGVTIVYVTHDQVEAMTLGDRIAVFNNGGIEQVGTPLEVYQSPINRFVAGFLGSPKINFLPASVLLGALPAQVETIGIRSEHLRSIPLDAAADTQTFKSLQGTLDMMEHLGDSCLAYVSVPGSELPVTVKLSAPQGQALHRHQAIQLAFAWENLLAFDQQGNRVDVSRG